MTTVKVTIRHGRKWRLNKLELLNKLNTVIDEKYCSVLESIFADMIDENNIGKNIDTYINIETGKIFNVIDTDDIDNISHDINSDYILHLGAHCGCDIEEELYEYLSSYEEKDICKSLGIYNEWLDNDENGCMSFKELLEACGKLEEYRVKAIESFYEDWDIGIRDLTLEDLNELDTEHINL